MCHVLIRLGRRAIMLNFLLCFRSFSDRFCSSRFLFPLLNSTFCVIQANVVGSASPLVFMATSLPAFPQTVTILLTLWWDNRVIIIIADLLNPYWRFCLSKYGLSNSGTEILTKFHKIWELCSRSRVFRLSDKILCVSVSVCLCVRLSVCLLITRERPW